MVRHGEREEIDRPYRNGRFHKTELQTWLEKHDPVERHAHKKRLRQAWGRIALFGATLSLVAGGADIHSNHNLENRLEPSITVTAEALNETSDDSALVVFGGYGEINGDATAKYTAPAIQQAIDGEIWSVDYNDADLDIDSLTQEMLTVARNNGISSFTLIGKSGGGVIATEVAEAMSAIPGAPQIEVIVLVQTPAGQAGVQPTKQIGFDIGGVLKYVPDLAYSTPIRLGYEFAARSGNGDSLFETWDKTWDAVMNRKVSSGWLMADQILAIQNAQFSDRLSTIGSAPDTKLKPLVIYLGTAAPGYDDVVNEHYSSEHIGGYALDAGLPFLHYEIPGAIHEYASAGAEAGMETLKNAIPTIQQKLGEQSLLFSIQNLRIKTPAYK